MRSAYADYMNDLVEFVSAMVPYPRRAEEPDEQTYDRKIANFDVRIHSAADFYKPCREVLAAHEPGPCHIFGDLMERIPPGVVDELRAQQEYYREMACRQISGHAICPYVTGVPEFE